MMEKRWFQIFIIFWALVVVVPYEADGANSNMTTATSTRIGSAAAAAGCNLFDGSWVLDPSYPPYNSKTCPFIDPEFDCQKYGRPDSGYQKYAWKPLSCTLPRFDGLDFLKRWKGKKIMLVGDSLSYNMWLSLACMIHASAPNLKTSHNTGTVSSIIFQEYEVSLLFHRQPFLVDVVQEKVGRVLKIDSIQTGAKTWLGMDLLIFNSWHWWTHTGKDQAWDYMEMEGKLYKDMDRLTAYSKGLATWANWVDLNVNPSSTKVFFQGISPTHYQGQEWNQPKQNCKGQTAPLSGSRYPAGLPPETSVVNKVVNSMKKKTSVNLLDITTLSQLRIDAHPSLYSGQHPGNDCAHWCLPGLPDTWNQLLYALLS